jgi:Zn-finger in ubiquitin-hydrolases and other protein
MANADRQADDGTTGCTHLDQVLVTEPPDEIEGCGDCLAIGGQWVHLRMCQTCGKVGCCESSPNRHASKHANAAGHPVLRSVEPGENWSWCVIDERAFVLTAS